MTHEEMKAWIDGASYEELLQRWRNEPGGSIWFDNVLGQHYAKAMVEKRSKIGPEAAAEISKRIGWEAAQPLTSARQRLIEEAEKPTTESRKLFQDENDKSFWLELTPQEVLEWSAAGMQVRWFGPIPCSEVELVKKQL